MQSPEDLENTPFTMYLFSLKLQKCTKFLPGWQLEQGYSLAYSAMF